MQVRCSGQPSGCNRCQAVGTQCRYPPREPRRKNRAGTCVDKTGTGTQSQKPKSDSKLSNEQDQGLKFSTRGTSEEGDGSAPGVDPQLLDQEMKSNSYWYQEFGGHGLATPISPHSGEEQGSNDRLDDWLDTNGILESEFPSIPGRVDDFHHFNTDMLNFGTVDSGNDNYFDGELFLRFVCHRLVVSIKVLTDLCSPQTISSYNSGSCELPGSHGPVRGPGLNS